MPTDPNQAAADWVAGLSSKTDKIARGVAAVTTPPGQAAARQVNVYTANVQANAQKWARRTAAVPLADWQNSMTQKGIPRIATGAQAAQSKFAAFMSSFLPVVDRARANLPARGTYEQNKARASAMMDALHAFGQSGQRQG